MSSNGSSDRRYKDDRDWKAQKGIDYPLASNLEAADYWSFFPFAGAFCSEAQIPYASGSAPAVYAGQEEAHLRLQQGIGQFDMGDYETARETLEQALVLYRQNRDRAGEGQALKNLGNVHQALADYEQEIEYQEAALKIARSINDKELQARALINLGSALKARGGLDEALLRYRESLSLTLQIGRRDLEAIAAAGLGIALYQSGQPAEAVPHMDSGLALARETGQKR